MISVQKINKKKKKEKCWADALMQENKNKRVLEEVEEQE